VPAISQRTETSEAENEEKEEQLKKQLDVKVADESHEKQVEEANQEALVEVDEARVQLEEQKEDVAIEIPELQIDYPSHVITYLSNTAEEPESDKVILVDTEDQTLYF